MSSDIESQTLDQLKECVSGTSSIDGLHRWLQLNKASIVKSQSSLALDILRTVQLYHYGLSEGRENEEEIRRKLRGYL